MRQKISIPLEEWFWTMVRRTETCWLWTGAPTTKGYGQFEQNGRQIYAHRFSFALANGPIPPGLQVLHSCPGGDNRLCVNPAHLRLGTPLDNMNDTMKRHPRFTTPRAPRVQRTTTIRSRKHAAKLTAVEVREIRQLLADRAMSYESLAAKFDVGRSTIRDIACGITWPEIVLD